MSIQNQYQVAAYNVSSGSTTIAATGNVTVHTVDFPKASAGIVRLADGDGSISRIIYPAASIGCMVLDASFANGLQVNAASADSFTVTYQIP